MSKSLSGNSSCLSLKVVFAVWIRLPTKCTSKSTCACRPTNQSSLWPRRPDTDQSLPLQPRFLIHFSFIYISPYHNNATSGTMGLWYTLELGCRELYMWISDSTLDLTGSQWKDAKTAEILPLLLDLIRSLSAVFWIILRLFRRIWDSPLIRNCSIPVLKV